jgi:methionyl aminopeptidase
MSKVTIKTSEEILKLKAGGHILARIMEGLIRAVRPGITTQQLEDLARKLVKEYQVKASFLGFGNPPYPAVLCTSVNEEVVHTIPSKRLLKDGDIIGIDFGIWSEGLCTDMARTAMVGEPTEEVRKLVEVTQKSLQLAEEQVKPNATIGDIGYAVQTFAEANGFSVVRSLVGHGVGYQVHEEPKIPNYGKKGQGLVLQPGMVLALEPMINLGKHEIEVRSNNWDVITKDRQSSAHFEDTIVVTQNGYEILTKI